MSESGRGEQRKTGMAAEGVQKWKKQINQEMEEKIALPLCCTFFLVAPFFIIIGGNLNRVNYHYFISGKTYFGAPQQDLGDRNKV